eukprot:3951869-Heterocapsa_arctica.AAC.1
MSRPPPITQCGHQALWGTCVAICSSTSIIDGVHGFAIMRGLLPSHSSPQVISSSWASSSSILSSSILSPSTGASQPSFPSRLIGLMGVVVTTPAC